MPVGILGDLCGPKVRVGVFVDRQPIQLVQGKHIRVRSGDEPGSVTCLTTTTAAVVRQLEVGNTLLLDDGNFRLRMTERIGEDEIECLIEVGGLLKEKKGINVPELRLALSAFTEKDRRDAQFILEQKLDFVALSFVQRAADILELTSFIDDFNRSKEERDRVHPEIIAKIEKPHALDDIDEIIAAHPSVNIMVARGDLGVEASFERVPTAQKMLIAKANAAGRAVITATQMLETMMNSPVPTRAEVSDVANAVFDGTDAVMLSGETAAGKYPLETVRMMASICLHAETQHTILARMVAEVDTSEGGFSFDDAIADASVASARKAEAVAIIVLTVSGKMAVRVSKRKPTQLIIAMTQSWQVANQLNLLWGVHPLILGKFSDTDGALLECERALRAREWVRENDTLVVCSGANEFHTGLSNTLKLHSFGHASRAMTARAHWKDALGVLQHKGRVHSPAIDSDPNHA
ncbi:pyruvate kinase [Capsaspora owczarzaki ATCC 30864]|uniref:Pyruvate kinase n=1 Tax=Capsaspora owczarzaki (strain ATCC 30864) TaxID=595528 RepID=A0A0D2UL24_CAPO3|nr:pyruvate kinase [Capsaspora owczarzaki ATCC 30864]KJE95796.1 pyruvate kinase [Capsaspora owczarzaki ATCC 30864]|eukprot:XP_004345801.1 pyruvate kinase [Capsaspora owczarzaki ATCC 30864]